LRLKCSPQRGFKKWQGTYSRKILNPYVDDISEHLLFISPLVVSINNSLRGEITCKKLKLNRPKLIEKRSEKILQLQGLSSRTKLIIHKLISE